MADRRLEGKVNFIEEMGKHALFKNRSRNRALGAAPPANPNEF